MSVAKIKAFKVPEQAIKAGRLPSYNEMCDGVQEMVPIAMRDIPNYDYVILEDVKGQVFVMKKKHAKQNLLEKRNLGEVKSDYFKPREKKVEEILEEDTETLLEELDNTLEEVNTESSEDENEGDKNE